MFDYRKVALVGVIGAVAVTGTLVAMKGVSEAPISSAPELASAFNKAGQNPCVAYEPAMDRLSAAAARSGKNVEITLETMVGDQRCTLKRTINPQP